MTAPLADLRRQGEAAADALPALMLAAEELAATVAPGLHGRRRAGPGEDFWQYRAAQPGEPARMIDWRRSARGDTAYVRDREWQAAQALTIWVDPAPSLTFAGGPGVPTKADRARVLALALAMLALRAGERVGLALPDAPPRPGRAQLPALAARLLAGLLADPVLATRGRAAIFTDGLGDPDRLAQTMAEAAGRGIRGVLTQVLDPLEASFPFHGRLILHEGALAHETREAGALRAAYLDRLAARRDDLARAAAAAGWAFAHHTTDAPPALALMSLYQALEAG